VRGERRVWDRKIQERWEYGLTADEKLRTEPRPGRWTWGMKCPLDSPEGYESDLGIEVPRIVDCDYVNILGSDECERKIEKKLFQLFIDPIQFRPP
jgi:hypothetical protein